MVVQYVRAVVITVSMIAMVATLIRRRANAHREVPHSYRPSRNEERRENMRQNEERSENMSNRNCTVCDESLCSGEQEKITLNLCRHTFHKLCLQSYQLARSLDGCKDCYEKHRVKSVHTLNKSVCEHVREKEHEDPNVCPIATCRASFL